MVLVKIFKRFSVFILAGIIIRKEKTSHAVVAEWSAAEWTLLLRDLFSLFSFDHQFVFVDACRLDREKAERQCREKAEEKRKAGHLPSKVFQLGCWGLC